jgi:hypothetical protein
MTRQGGVITQSRYRLCEYSGALQGVEPEYSHALGSDRVEITYESRRNIRLYIGLCHYLTNIHNEEELNHRH